MVFSLIDCFFSGVAIIASRCDYISKGGRPIWVNRCRAIGAQCKPLSVVSPIADKFCVAANAAKCRSGHRAPSFKRKRPPTEVAYLNFTNSISVVSHTGHSKVRMSRVGPSASMQASHIGVPHMRHNGRSMVTECEGTI